MPAPNVVRVAIGIVSERGRVLIARRPDHVPLAGSWEFPGGKIEAGETPEAAVVRELAEELAVTVEPVERLATLRHDYPHACIELTPILCRRLAGEPKAIACQAWRWVTAEDLPAYPFPPANAPLLAALLARWPATDPISDPMTHRATDDE